MQYVKQYKQLSWLKWRAILNVNKLEGKAKHLKNFLDKNFLLGSAAAETLFHDYAKDMPIVDYHCHVSPKEIYEDKHFANIAEAWLAGDHYKWRLMRANGVDEKYITGNAPDREKFQKFAETLPRAIGNPMYHWCHLELKTYLGYEGILNGETAQEVWDLSQKVFAKPEMGVRGLICMSNVRFIGTTDDPTDTLEWHEKIAADKTFAPTVAPSFRPDKALNIDKDGWRDYIKTLSAVSGIEICDLASLQQALRARMEHFAAHGCRASDHGLDRMVCRDAGAEEVNSIMQAALAGESVSAENAEMFKTALMRFCAGEYVRLGWAMQIHYNALRNPNTALYRAIGPDTGFDSVGPNNGIAAMSRFLDGQFRAGQLPRTVVYSLDGKDNAALDALIGAFQGNDIPGSLQHGSAWWFNDTKTGMLDQLTNLANLGILGNFIGMLTDSRSFLSYTRHEYFRRILCDLIGGWIENGEYPADFQTVGAIVQDICCNNAVRYFRLEEK